MDVQRSASPVARPERLLASHWLGLALGVLTLAGLFSLVVVVGRMPPFDRLVSDPLFFRRGLVAHVNFALVTWFYSFVACLLFLVAGRREPGWVSRHAVHASLAGVLMMLLAAQLPGARPVLSNYIPVLDHELFLGGQLLFAAGVVASFVGRGVLLGRAPGPSFFELPAAATLGLRATGAALVLAALTFLVTAFRITPDLAVDVHYELLFWGGGHVLQLACSLAMVSVWLVLLDRALGRSPVSAPAARLLFLALLLPWLVAPFLALQGTWSPGYRAGFTSLMRWSIFPVVTIFLILCGKALFRAAGERRPGPSPWRDPRVWGFLVSAALTLLGFALGAAIRGSNTMVPAHYHASIGGVTAAFMTVTYLLLPELGLPVSRGRLRRAASWQPVVYGVGQMVFAAGFALAGLYGMSRKSYGAEQAGRGLGESIGLGVMGVGGLLAVAGGLLFLGVVAAVWRRNAGARTSALELEAKA